MQYLDVGGLEALVIGLSSNLKKKDINVEVLCLNQIDMNYAAALKKNNIPVHFIKEKGLLNLLYYIRITSFIYRKRYDVVHLHSGCHIIGSICSKLAGIKKVIFTAHGVPCYTRLLDRFEDNISLSFASDIVSVSNEINDFLKEWLMLGTPTFHIITNGVSITSFEPISDVRKRRILCEKYNIPPDIILIGSVGRFDPVKNYAMVLKAFKQLLNSVRIDLNFVLVGDGPEMGSLKKLCDELKITKKVHFLGVQYKVCEIIPLFNVFVLSSRTEGTSISLLESQACGVPAVVTDVGGNGNVISHGVNGFLCEVDNIDQMEYYLRKLVTNLEMAKMMGLRGRSKVEERFSIEVMTEQYIKIYFGMM